MLILFDNCTLVKKIIFKAFVKFCAAIIEFGTLNCSKNRNITLSMV